MDNKITPKLKDIKNKLLISLDIGGSLIKICIITEKNEKSINDFISSKNIFEKIDLNQFNLFFTSIQTINFEKLLFPILKDLNDITKIKEIDLTGGGAYKYNDILKKTFDIELVKHDELQSLIYGYEFMNNFNSFYEIENDLIKKLPQEDLKFPHISANIGSGVSILKVSANDKYERVGGTLMGGGTLIGLSKLIFGIDDYDKIIELASKGNNENVDLTMKDFPNNKENEFENPEISSLGKIHEYIQSGKKDKLKKEDIALSLIKMICSHIAQYSVIYAEKNNIDTIYYFGSFTKNNFINKILHKASKHWNKNIKVRFNCHDGYLGTIGTLLITK